MKRVTINVTKLDKSAIYEGKNGKYLDLTLFDNREGRDQYGNDGFVTQDLGKERRLAGEKGPILGNWKDLDGASQVKPSTAPSYSSHQDSEDNIPF